MGLHNFVFVFQLENGLHGKMKKSRIYGSKALIVSMDFEKQWTIK